MVRKTPSIPFPTPPTDFGSESRRSGERFLPDKSFKGASQRRLQFDDIIPNGVVTQTANGTSKDVGTGWNKEYNWEMPEVSEKGAWQKPNSNRTGE